MRRLPPTLDLAETIVTYRVEHAGRNPEPFGEYRLRIFKDGQLVARYWHDYRGDAHGIEFLDGSSDSCPVGRMIDFIEGGGPQPLVLTPKAVEYLDRKFEGRAT